MNLDTPNCVHVRDGRLYWAPVEGAHGYNIHRDGKYKASVNKPGDYAVSENEAVDLLTVSAFTREIHTPRSEAAISSPCVPEGLRFEENFQRFDPAHWNDQLYWGPQVTNNNSLHTYNTRKMVQDGEFDPLVYGPAHLTIRAKRQRSLYGKPWQSGVICTAGKHDFITGYFEIEARFPAHRGIWPAFWLLCTKYDGLVPEIDIMEYLGHEPFIARHNVHRLDPGLISGPEGSGEILANAWNKYGMEWEEDRLTYYVNGFPTHIVTGDQVPRESMYIIINLAIGGDWPGAPDESLTETWAQFRKLRVYDRVI